MNNTNCLSFEAHMLKLRESIPGIRISYRPGYDEDGPCIGIRAAIGDVRTDFIDIDNTMWLIAGDIVDKRTNRIIRSMREMKFAEKENLRVQMRGQACAAGGIVGVTLGNYDVTELQYVNEDLGFAMLGHDR